jgi:hypothetical protein
MTPADDSALGEALAFCGRRSDQYTDAMRADDESRKQTPPTLPVPMVAYDVSPLASVPPPNDSRDFGLALLIAEADDHAYEPVGVVGSLREAVDLSIDDFAGRVAHLEAGADPLCRAHYVVWARDAEGRYRLAYRITR